MLANRTRSCIAKSDTRHFHLGMSAQAIRADRIVDETYATPGDLRRICDFFGVTMNSVDGRLT